MPGLQELVYRNRGVQVYSPTRALPTRRSFGGQANAGTARQILGGASPSFSAQPRTTSFNFGGGVATPLGGLPNWQPPTGSVGGGSIIDNMLARQNLPQPEQPGGWRGALGIVANSLPGRMILGGLEVLDRPRRAVVSGVQEVADAINGGDASWDDFVNQFNDPNFGFEQVIGDTGNVWANRVIGFTGDVLLDPTTYIMGGGVIAGVGGKFRVGAAARAAAAGLDESMIARIGRLGYSGLDNKTRRILAEQAGERVLRRGMHFKVPFMEKYLHIPGTGVVDRLLAGGPAKLRARAAATGPFTTLRRWMAPEGLEAAYEKLITGRGAMGFAEAGELITFRNAADRVGKTVLGRLAADAARTFRASSSDDVNRLLTQAETEGGTVVNEFFDRARTILNDAGVRFDARKNYVPHIYTDAAADWLRGTDPRAINFRKAFDITGTDPEDLSPVLMQRKFVPRDEPYMVGGRQVTKEVMEDGKLVNKKVWEGGREFNIKTGTIEEMNTEFARVFPELGIKLLDDDITSIVARYSKSVYDTAGAVGGFKALLNSKQRLLRAADDDEAMRLVVDAGASRYANEKVQEELNIQLSAYSKISKQIREDTLRGISGIQGVAGVQLHGMIDELRSLETAAKQRLDDLLTQEQELVAMRGGTRYRWQVNPDGSVTEVGRVEAEPGALQRELERNISELTDRYDAAERERARLARAAGIEKAAWQDARSMAVIERKVSQLPQSFRNFNEFQRLSRESAQLAMDLEKLHILRQRLAQHEATAGLAERMLREDSFVSMVTRPDDPDPFVPPETVTEAAHRRQPPKRGQPVFEHLPTEYRRTWDPHQRKWITEVVPRARRLRHTVDDEGRIVEAGWKEVIHGASPAQIRGQHQAQRATVLGDSPAALEIAARIGREIVVDGKIQYTGALGDLYRAEQELTRQASIHTLNIQDRHDEFQRWRTVEAELEADIDNLSGSYRRRKQRIEREDQLRDLQAPDGILNQARRMYEEAKRPVDEAKQRVALEQRNLDRLLNEQMQLARAMDAEGRGRRAMTAPRAEPPELAAANEQRRALQGQLNELEQGRAQLARRKDGQRVLAARSEAADLDRQLDEVSYEISRYTTTKEGAPFSIDENGNVVMRLAAQDEDLARRINARDALIPEADELRRAYEVADADFEDALRRDAAGEAVDLVAAERAMRNAGLAADAAQRELDEANILIARWQPRLERRAYRHRQLLELVGQRQAITKRRAALQRTLDSKLSKRADFLDAAITRTQQRLADQNQVVADALATAARAQQAATPAPFIREQALGRINSAERAALSNVRTTYHIDWEPVPTLNPRPDRGQLRVGAYDFEDRVALEEAYRVIRDRKNYPRAPDGQENSIVRDARETIQRITTRPHRITLRDALAGETVYDQAQAGYRAIERARTPLMPTDELTQVLSEAARAPGGANTIVDRAKLARNVVRSMITDSAEEFANRGAISTGLFHKLDEMMVEHANTLALYGEKPLPHLRQQLEQQTADLGRWGDFMISYKAVLDAGFEPNDQMATFLLERQLFKENEVLDTQIARHEKLIRDGGERAIAEAHARRTLKYESRYFEEREALDELLAKRGRGERVSDKKIAQTRDRMNRARRTWEKLAAEHPEVLGLMTDDVDALAYILREGMEEVDRMLQGVETARWASGAMQWPNVRKAQLLASVPFKQGQYAEMRAAQRRLGHAIFEARRTGQATVSYIPERTVRFRKSGLGAVQIDEARARLEVAPPYLRETLRQRIDAAERRGQATVEWTEHVPEMTPVELSHDEAMQRFRDNADALDTLRRGIDDDQLSLDVLQGTAQIRMRTLQQQIADQTNPPNPAALRRENRDIARTARRERRARTPEEERRIELNKARLAWLEVPMSADQVARAQREILDIQQRIDQFMTAAGDNAQYLQATIDDGAQLFNDLINGRIEPTAGNLRLIIQFLGGEEGHFARGWVQTLQDYLLGPAERIKQGGARITETDVQEVLADMRRVYGTQELTESLINRGILNAERRRAELLATGQLDPETAALVQEAQADIGEIAEAGELLATDALDIPSVREGALNSMIAAAKAVSRRQTAEFMELLEVLNIRFGPDVQTASAAMTAMGFRMTKRQRHIDEEVLRRFVIDRLTESGYTPATRLEDQVMHLKMRRARLETMRRSLGGQINLWRARRDPLALFQLLEEPVAETTEGVVREARMFNELVEPEDMAQVLDNRIASLEQDLVEAVKRGDGQAMDSIAKQINELNEGARPLPAQAPPNAAIAQPIANVVGEADVAIDEARHAATAELREVEEQIAKVESQMVRLNDDVRDLDLSEFDPPDPPTLEEQLANPNPNKPPGVYSRAEVQANNLERLRLIEESGEAEFTPEQAARVAELNRRGDQMMVPYKVPEGGVTGGPWNAEPAKEAWAADAAFEIAAGERGRGWAGYRAIADRDIDQIRLALNQRLTELQFERNRLTQQLSDTGQPSETQLDAVRADVTQPSQLEAPTLSDADEGISPPPAIAPDEAEIRRVDESIISDSDLEYDELVEEMDATKSEYQSYMDEYGSFEGAPQQVQQTMLELAARGRRLSQLQSGAIRRARAADREAAEAVLPNYARHMQLRREPRRPSVSNGWRHVLTDGTPSQNVIAAMREHPLAPEVAAMDLDEVIAALRSKEAGLQHLRGDLFRRLRELEPQRWRRAHPVLKLTGKTTRGGMESTVRARWSGSMMARGSLDEQQRMIDKALQPLEETRAELAARAGRERRAAEPLREQIEAIEASAAAEPGRIARRAELSRQRYPDVSDIDTAAEVSANRYAHRMRLEEIKQATIDNEYQRAMSQYNEGLTRLDMQLADVRNNILWAGRDYQGFTARRAELERALTRKPTTTTDMRAALADLHDINQLRREIPPTPPGQKPTPEQVAVADIEAMLVAAAKGVDELERIESTEELIIKRIGEFAADAGRGTTFGNVVERVVADGWQEYASKTMKGQDALVIADSLASAMRNLQNAMRTPETWNLVGKYTAFFKTYATAKPGFHVRNAISAVFMNLVANVRMGRMWEAMWLWRRMMKNPTKAWAQMTDREREAFSVVWGSGAAGQFEEVGVGTVSTPMGKAYRKLMNNRITHWNRRSGAAVEGTARLAMALDGFDKKLSAAASLDRVRQYHFDYTQLSRLDRVARQMIPFWTFMSRNLPLQLNQFMLRPRSYQHYRSFVRNFSETADPLTPEYWLAQGAFTLDPNAANEERPWYLSPDLPHLRVTEPFEQIAQGRIGAATLANANPLYLAPIESFGFGKKLYTDQEIENTYNEPTWMMERLMPLFKLLGGTETAGSGEEVLDERYAHLTRSLLPPIDLLERLTIGLGSQEARKTSIGREGETWARFFGAPVYRLTPELREAQRKREYYRRKEQLTTQAELARM